MFNPQEKKLDSRTVSGYFIGYPESSKGYRFHCLSHTTRIIESNNAKSLENHQNSESDETRKITYNEIRDAVLPDRSGVVVPLNTSIQEVQPP